MCVCVCVYIYVCVYTHTYVYMHICLYAYIHICLCVYTYIDTSAIYLEKVLNLQRSYKNCKKKKRIPFSQVLLMLTIVQL